MIHGTPPPPGQQATAEQQAASFWAFVRDAMVEHELLHDIPTWKRTKSTDWVEIDGHLVYMPHYHPPHLNRSHR